MLLKSILAASALALQTSAFLIPLEVSEAARITQIDKELKHQVVKLDCPACPFAGPNGDGSAWTKIDDKISILLEFDISDDDQFLQINQQPVFPPPMTLMPIALKASQISELERFQTQPLRLGYALEILPVVSEVTDITLIPIQLTILDLQGIPVKIDTVRIDLVQSWGHLRVARITTLPYSQSPGAEQCITSICRLRAIIAHRLREMIHAAKAHAGKAKTWFKNGCPGRKHAAQAATEQDGQKSHHHAHHAHGRVRHFIKQTVHFFILPALFGVFGGLLACAVGMLVGHGMARLLSYRSSRGIAPRNLEDAVENDEKDGLVVNGEMPPQYEDGDVIVIEQK